MRQGFKTERKYELGSTAATFISANNTVDTNDVSTKGMEPDYSSMGAELIGAIDDFPDSVYTNGITWKRRLQERCREMHALIIEIDNVAGIRGLKRAWCLPGIFTR